MEGGRPVFFNPRQVAADDAVNRGVFDITVDVGSSGCHFAQACSCVWPDVVFAVFKQIQIYGGVHYRLRTRMCVLEREIAADAVSVPSLYLLRASSVRAACLDPACPSHTLHVSQRERSRTSDWEFQNLIGIVFSEGKPNRPSLFSHFCNPHN